MTRDSLTPKGWLQQLLLVARGSSRERGAPGSRLIRCLSSVASLVLLRATATAFAVVGTGFMAVSDDDFARVVLAQGFAEHPRWDPSGSSWLPFPFWLNGAAMLVFGPHFWVARALSVVTSLLSPVLLYVAGRWCGLTRPAAWLAAALSAVMPHAVWLGYATVPEGLTAAMLVLSVASAAQPTLSRRMLGAALLLCATLSRYESWPLAATVACFHLADALRTRRPALLGAAAACAVGPAAWLLHGLTQHGDAWFFVTRVAEYRQQLGRSPILFSDALLGYPEALVRGEPEVVTLAVLGWLATRTLGDRDGTRRRSGSRATGLSRLLTALALLLVFLVVGDLRDGAPTHHPERPLLACWLGLCLVVGDALLETWHHRRRLLPLAAVALVGVSIARPMYTRRDGFIDRSDELRFGQHVGRHLGAGERLLVDVGDYGYFAIIAGFERPSLALGLADTDPRQARPESDAPLPRLRFWAERTGAEHVVVQRERTAELRALGPPELEDSRFALLRLPPTLAPGSGPKPK